MGLRWRRSKNVLLNQTVAPSAVLPILSRRTDCDDARHAIAGSSLLRSARQWARFLIFVQMAIIAFLFGAAFILSADRAVACVASDLILPLRCGTILLAVSYHRAFPLKRHDASAPAS
jgi:hypothetical protein